MGGFSRRRRTRAQGANRPDRDFLRGGARASTPSQDNMTRGSTRRGYKSRRRNHRECSE